MFCENYEEFVAALTKKGYVVHSAATAAQAADLAVELAGQGSCGFGGSITLRDLGVYERLAAQGNTLYWHWKDPEHAAQVRRDAQFADTYFTSANGISRSGALVNIDGMGNRVAASFYGPKQVVFVIGKNKFAETLEGAMDHARQVASPLNAQRLGCKTPCAVTGKCADCDSPGRICNVFVIIDRPTMGLDAMHLILVDEELGY